ncbi:DUF917 domain-containing protein [Thalassomonas actiniarum]|uniref:DUF917 domain-containing protein n=1 Tax=Thalassomonas actiniarum TaxID=485447 RepID=A0AAE9YP27_9GAMM|nr:DUF917 domain-containing protein [Thalassomonas actiniarum]WDD97888.1 DUF917 domain-containing protein [Thalassomonas actiniarum]
MTKLNNEDLQWLLEGATFLGCGGGGSYSVGKEILAAAIALGKDIVLISAEDLPLDSLAISPAAIGSPDAVSAQDDSVPFIASAPKAFDALQMAINSQRETPEPAEYVIAGETGPWATTITLYLAAKKNLTVIDGDGGGRAMPQLNMTYFTAQEVIASPISVANDATQASKSVVSTSRVGSTDLAGDVVRGIISTDSFGNTGAFATWPMGKKDVVTASITNSLSFTLKVGEAITRHKSDPDKYPLSEVLDVLRAERGFAEIIMNGKLCLFSETTDGTFDMGQARFKDKTTGRSLYIYNKNENMIAYFEDETSPAALAPDSICFLREDGSPTTNADITPEDIGQSFYIIGFSSDQRMRNLTTVTTFLDALKDMGYAGRFEPIEELSKHWPA